MAGYAATNGCDLPDPWSCWESENSTAATYLPPGCEVDATMRLVVEQYDGLMRRLAETT